MKIKMFMPNDNGKIELSLEELQKLVDEAYEEGKQSILYIPTKIETPPSSTVYHTSEPNITLC